MVQCQRAHLDTSFAALSDAARRGILERLGRADASITDLAEKFHMTLTGMKKHVGVLEQAGLVITEKGGRGGACKIGPYRLEERGGWRGGGSSSRRRLGACGPASSACTDWRKRRHGSRGTASAGTHGSTNWTRL